MAVSEKIRTPVGVPPETRPRSPLDKRPGGLQNRSWRSGEGKNRTYTGDDYIDRSLYTSNV